MRSDECKGKIELRVPGKIFLKSPPKVFNTPPSLNETRKVRLSDIPRARELLLDVADGLRNGAIDSGQAADEIASIVRQYMFRPSPIRRAPSQSHTPDARDRVAMRRAALANPNVPLREIGRQFGLDGGRVSEAIRSGVSSTRTGVAPSAASLFPTRRLSLGIVTGREHSAFNTLSRVRPPDLRAAVRRYGRPMQL
jgi:hypothetical protein